jgi:acyl-[acyl-carrier-protein]-phospholipid O-acyltransferase/long-chain-fatty-acid--[acyl-carrier-protein] ligase
VGFLYYGQTGYPGLLVVLFLMGTHSAFFGPPKYGVLPQLVTDEELPRANGLILMTTFLAIIFGTALAGGLKTLLMGANGDAGRIWLGSLGCIGIAMVGTLTSLMIRPLPPQSPELRFHFDALAIPRETLALLWRDRSLLAALLVSSLFWLMSGIAVQAVNSLGKVQLGLSDLLTSLLTAAIGIGIACGAVIAGRLTHGATDFRFVSRGAWGMVLMLLLIAASLPVSGGWKHLLGFGGSLPVLMLLGASAGMFAVPVQVFLQTRPPKDQKGRIIAAMNLTNFIAIMLSGVIYGVMDRVANAASLPRSFIFVLIAALMVPILLRKNGGLGVIPSTPH